MSHEVTSGLLIEKLANLKINQPDLALVDNLMNRVRTAIQVDTVLKKMIF